MTSQNTYNHQVVETLKEVNQKINPWEVYSLNSKVKEQVNLILLENVTVNIHQSKGVILVQIYIHLTLLHKNILGRQHKNIYQKVHVQEVPVILLQIRTLQRIGCHIEEHYLENEKLRKLAEKNHTRKVTP